MTHTLLALAFAAMTHTVDPAWPTQADAFFAAVVRADGLVDYTEAQRRRGDLDRLVAALAPAQGLTDDRQRLALYINAYNLFTIQQVLDHWPVQKVTSVPGFFDVRTFELDGRILTLNAIENQLIRPLHDPRIHAALVCAAVSCPPLRQEAYHAHRLEQQLDENARRWINHPAKNHADDQQLSVSMIFQWYAADFSGGPVPFVQRFAAPDRPIAQLLARQPSPPVQYLPYDWSLNAAN